MRLTNTRREARVGVEHAVALAVRVQHDDVAARRPLDRVPEARGQQPIARQQRARHRVARDAEDADDAALQAVGEQQREQKRQRELDGRSGCGASAIAQRMPKRRGGQYRTNAVPMMLRFGSVPQMRLSSESGGCRRARDRRCAAP